MPDGAPRRRPLIMLVQSFVLAANHLLRAQPWACRCLKPFAGRTARLEMPPLRLVVVITPEGTLAEAAAAEVDVAFELPAVAPLLAWRGREALLKAARVSGAADFAEALGTVARNLSWDFEEDLSHVMGDVAAHRLAQLLRGLAEWPRTAGLRLSDNVSEYLREEQPLLASRPAFSGLGKTTGELELTLHRLAARIERLEGQRRART